MNSMGRLFGQSWWPSREHCGEDVLLSLLDGELSIMQARRVQKHLERCWTCRARRDQLEKTIRRFVGYRTRLVRPHMPPPPNKRERFIASLNELIESRKQPWWSHFAHKLPRLAPQTMIPVLASILVVGAAATLLFYIWQATLPPMSAQELLGKAQVWDAQPSAAIRPGVAYQKVQIRNRTSKLERAIYRDLAGKRTQRAVALTPANEALKQEVESAGVDWQQPLSASDFRAWRDHLTLATDKVARSGDRLISLTTSLRSGPVASETLTVRASDFHPVGRVIEMRDEDRIEIAELSYAVLDWHEVNEALFEPVVSASHAPVTAAMHLRMLPSAGQLDLAELQARLVLNKLNADSTEQLEFSRSRSTVQIKGIVENTERKNALVTELRQVPHVLPAIFSIEELKARQDSAIAVWSIQAYSVVGQPSPLERYLQAHGRSKDDVSQVSRELLDAVAAVKQETSAIDDLHRRFASNEDLGDSGRSVLNELLSNHATKLKSALDAEDIVIGNALRLAAFERPSISIGENVPVSLSSSGDRDMALCRELVSSDAAKPRALEAIAVELLATTQQIRAALNGLSSSLNSPPETINASPRNQ
jgi:hypothetical protein